MDEDEILAAIAEARRKGRLGLKPLAAGLARLRVDRVAKFERVEAKLTSMTDGARRFSRSDA